MFWEAQHWQQLSINGEAYTGEGSDPLGSEKPVITYNGLISKIRLSSTTTSRSAGALSGIGWDGVDLVFTLFPSPETQPAVNSFNAAEIVSTDLAANTITVDSGNWVFKTQASLGALMLVEPSSPTINHRTLSMELLAVLEAGPPRRHI